MENHHLAVAVADILRWGYMPWQKQAIPLQSEQAEQAVLHRQAVLVERPHSDQ